MIMICTNCGYSITTDGVDFCPNCGAQLNPSAQQYAEPTPVQEYAEPITTQHYIDPVPVQQYVDPTPVKEEKQKNSNKTPVAIACVVAVVVLLVSTMLIFREPISDLISGSGEKTEETTKKKDKNKKEEQNETTDSEETNDSNATDTETNDSDATTPESNPNGSQDELIDQIPSEDEESDGVTKENVHEKFNEWTAAAAKGSYKFTRVCQYTPGGAVDVGNATSTLDKVIKAVDSNASLDSVVGSFLGIGTRNGEVRYGSIPNDMNANYALKAMKLTASDIKAAGKDGNTYIIQINACANPKKDNSNSLSRATNDFFTHEEVVEGITAYTSAIKVEGTNVEYTEIILAATVVDGKMTKLEISYTFAATMNLKVAVVGVEGKCKATNVITYYDIVY